MDSDRNENPGRGAHELRLAAKDRGRELIRRRRRATTAALALVVAAGTGVVVVLVAFGPRSSVPSATHTTRPTPSSRSHARPTVHTTALAGHGRLAFVSGGELYVLDGATRSLRRVTEGSPLPSSPAFSPDGKWLAFVRAAPGSSGAGEILWMARGDGTDAHRVTRVPEAYPAADSGTPVFAWSPTRDELVVTAGSPVNAPLVPRQVWIVPAPGMPYRLLGPGYTSGAVWSPDGTDVAVLWSSHGISSTVLETLPAAGGTPTVWLPADNDATYFLAGWAPRFGILVWDDQGNGGPSVEDTGLTLAALSQPGTALAPLASAPIFDPPALAIGTQGGLAVVAEGDPSGGGGEGVKFVWFGKTVESCSAASDHCSSVIDQPSSVTLDPAISPVDGSLAFVVAPQSTEGLPPDYSPGDTWAQISGWYASHELWIDPGGTATPVAIAGTTGASDPTWSRRGTSLVYVADGGLWLLPNSSSEPVEVASPVALPPSRSGQYLFGYVDWSDQFSWTG